MDGANKGAYSRSLAQKLTIRMSDDYAFGKLVEINANSMLSKWLGESGKVVDQIFENVSEIARDRATLVFVLIDEVESIAGSRAGTSARVECTDTLRASVVIFAWPSPTYCIRQQISC